MIQEFVIILDSPFMLTCVEEAALIAQNTIEECVQLGEEPPPKFQLCIQACGKMLTLQGINRKEYKGLVDTIGGYYMAMDRYVSVHGEDHPGQLAHARELMRFARQLEEKVKPLWGLSLVKNEAPPTEPKTT